MSELPQTAPSPETEEFLSGAYRRILWITLVLTVASAILAISLGGWGSGFGLLAGALLGSLNFVWLHHGTELTVQRMLTPGTQKPSQHRVVFAFIGRYLFVLAAAYVILKGYPQEQVAFILGLALPVTAAMCEGVYEAIATSNN
jgi:hypothetical protein